MKQNGSEMGHDQSNGQSGIMKKQESHKSFYSRDVMPGVDLWKDGLICAFELVRRRRRSVPSSKSASKMPSRQMGHESSKTRVPELGLTEDPSPTLRGSSLTESSSAHEFNRDRSASFHERNNSLIHQSGQYQTIESLEDSHWVAIGWDRISELVQTVQTDAGWASHQLEPVDDEDDLTVADRAAPYWERPAGPVWWCHVDAGHLYVQSWLSNAQWLHPAISLALRNEERLISERMKHLLYEVPVRVAGGLLFELLGQSVGDPFVDEDDIPVVLRSWQADNFLITALHIKGKVSRVNILGITEVQELLSSGGYYAPRTVHEVIALLASRLTCWDDRLFRKSIFNAADEIELKFMNRRNQEDMNLFIVIMNREIRRLSTQVIRVKWSLHAREEIMFELHEHLRGNGARALLDEIRKSTREMMEEQEAVRGRLFTIQDVMQSNVRAWLQDRSLRVTHNLAVFGGCGLVLSIITGLFGINVDGIPGAASTPYAFGLFAAILFLIGVVLIGVGLIFLGLKKPITEEQVEERNSELQELVKMFQHEAESHAQVRKSMHRTNLTPTPRDILPRDVDYIVIQ